VVYRPFRNKLTSTPMRDASRTLRAVPCDDSFDIAMWCLYRSLPGPRYLGWEGRSLRKQLRRHTRRADASVSGARFEPRSRLGIITHGETCLNKTVFLTLVLWWFFKGWQSFIRCIGHCTLVDIFQTTFRELALRPCSGNWLPLYWQKWIFF